MGAYSARGRALEARTPYFPCALYAEVFAPPLIPINYSVVYPSRGWAILF